MLKLSSNIVFTISIVVSGQLSNDILKQDPIESNYTFNQSRQT